MNLVPIDDTTNLDNFYYLIFQSYPTKQRVYYWVDGDKAKKVLPLQKFIHAMDRVDSLKRDLYEALSTTSYYLYDNVSSQILKLDPKSIFETYTYPLQQIGRRKDPSKKVYEYDKKEKKTTLDDQLNMLGFEPPDETKIKNLQISLIKVKKEIQ